MVAESAVAISTEVSPIIHPMSTHELPAFTLKTAYTHEKCITLLLKIRQYKVLLMLSKVLEKALEIPLDCKEIRTVNPKGNQPCIFTGRSGAG